MITIATRTVDWARRAGVELPQASDYNRLLSRVQEHRQTQQYRMDPNAAQPKTSYVAPNTPAVRTVTPSVTAPVPSPVRPVIPAAMPAARIENQTPNQAANLASIAAIEKAKPPALALLELLKLGPAKEKFQSGIARLNAGASSQATTSTGGSHFPLPPPVGNAAPAVVQHSTEVTAVNGEIRRAPPHIVTDKPIGVTVSTGSMEAPPAVEEPEFEILASIISAPKTTEPTSSSVTPAASASMVVLKGLDHPKRIDESTEVATSQSIAISEAEPRMPESSISIRETITTRPETMTTLEIDQRDPYGVVNRPDQSMATTLEIDQRDPYGVLNRPDQSIATLEIDQRETSESDVNLSIEPSRDALPREATPAPPPLRPKTPEDPYGVVNMRTIRSIPANRMWVEIPVSRPRPPTPRARSLSPRRFNFCLPEKTYERFDKDCKSKVLSRTLMKRTNLRLCGWDECDAELGSEWQLEQHVRKVHVPRAKPVKRHHTEVDAWVCNWGSCNRPYTTSEHLDQHLQAVHVQQGLVCPYRTCLHRDTVFPNVHVLEIHIARSPMLHKRENVVPLTDLSVEGPIPLDCKVPAAIPRDALLPLKVFRTIWPTDRIKRNAINKVQEFSFVDRESPRMRPGESPPPMDMPMPAPLLQEEESAADEDTIVVKSEQGTAPPYTLRRAHHQSYKSDLVKAKTGSKPIKREMEVEVVIELSRAVITGV